MTEFPSLPFIQFFYMTFRLIAPLPGTGHPETEVESLLIRAVGTMLRNREDRHSKDVWMRTDVMRGECIITLQLGYVVV